MIYTEGTPMGEERTFKFAKKVRDLVTKTPKTMSNLEYGKQLIRSSSSVGTNYIEANESLSKKDFFMRIKICRKEAKESAYWLRLIKETNSLKNAEDARRLIQEANELKKIFSSSESIRRAFSYALMALSNCLFLLYSMPRLLKMLVVFGFIFRTSLNATSASWDMFFSMNSSPAF